MNTLLKYSNISPEFCFKGDIEQWKKKKEIHKELIYETKLIYDELEEYWWDNIYDDLYIYYYCYGKRDRWYIYEKKKQYFYDLIIIKKLHPKIKVKMLKYYGLPIKRIYNQNILEKMLKKWNIDIFKLNKILP